MKNSSAALDVNVQISISGNASTGQTDLGCAAGYNSHIINLNGAKVVQFGNTFAVVVSPDDG
jgi:hypothetical protein